MIRSFHSFFATKLRDTVPMNVTHLSTIVLSTFPPELLNSEIRDSLAAYRKNRNQLDTKLEKYLASGLHKCAQGKHSSGLSDFQKILASMNHEDPQNLTKKQTQLLAKTHIEAARVLCVGTVEEERIALEHVDKAMELVPDMEEALVLKRSIVSGNSMVASSF